MNLNTIIRPLISVILLTISLTGANAQSTKFVDDIDQDAGCEMTAKLLEYVLIETGGEQLFILSRLGAGEKSIGWKRLKKVETLLARASIKPRFVLAEASPTGKAKGSLEFWIGSRPRAIVRFKRNQQFCIDTPEHLGP